MDSNDNPEQAGFTPLSTPPLQGQGNTATRAVVEAVFRHRRAIEWTAGAVMAVTLLYVLFCPRAYQSEMNILVRNARPDYLLSPERNTNNTAPPEVTEEKINSEIEVLKSKDVADAVVDPNWPSKPLAERTPSEIKAHEKAVLSYGKHLAVEALRKSNVIHVSFTASSPAVATETVNRLLGAFLAKQREIERSTGASRFFDTEAQRYKSELDEAQRQLAGYQQANQMVSLTDKENTLQQQITGLEEAVRSTQVQIDEATNRLANGNGQLKSMPSRMSTTERSIPNTYSVEQLTTLLANLQNQRTALLVKFLPTDRLVEELNKQIADTKAALQTATDAKGAENTTDVNPVYQQVKSSVTATSTELRALRGRLVDQTAQLDRLKATLVNIEGSTVDYTTLQAKVTELQGNYQLYSQKRNEAEIADAMDQQNLVNVAVAERPTYQAKAYRPEPLLNLALGTFTAIFLAACVAFFAEMGRDTVAAPYELEMLTRIPVLATVPFVAAESYGHYPPSRPSPAPFDGGPGGGSGGGFPHLSDLSGARPAFAAGFGLQMSSDVPAAPEPALTTEDVAVETDRIEAAVPFVHVPEPELQSPKESPMLDFLKPKPAPSIVPEPVAERGATFAPIEPMEPVAHSAAPLRSSIRTANDTRPALPMARMVAVEEPVVESIAIQAVPAVQPAPFLAPIEPREPVAHSAAPLRAEVLSALQAAPEVAPAVIAAPVVAAPVLPPVEEDKYPEIHFVATPRPALREETADSAASESEPRHRTGRLAAARESVLGDRARLSPSQRAQRTRPETTRDRYGRLTYVTYTADGLERREQSKHE
ncbi:Uncharacterized protein involved in exopolysaccharide biosynthesis [Granulicella rosea]|uniref:Uncharacterized protein involved in exopolysaccharide biosynthesis n=2 Tax=Granulicella rosea TaxID=474952 RepID=A0A239JLR9_9BACT|nr:Uncharacterized protein involved in exopolysaccharide biosynthesis [Granulicella rosea]